MKKKIGIDLDGVVYNFISPFDKFILNKGFTPIVNKYDRGLSRENKRMLLNEFALRRPFLSIPIYPLAASSLQKINGQFDVYIITFRDWYKEGIEDTLTRLKEDKIEFKDIIFTSEKGIASKRIGLDYFVEDLEENILNIVESSPGIKPFLISRRYNNVITNVPRVSNLEEVFKSITKDL